MAGELDRLMDAILETIKGVSDRLTARLDAIEARASVPGPAGDPSTFPLIPGASREETIAAIMQFAEDITLETNIAIEARAMEMAGPNFDAERFAAAMAGPLAEQARAKAELRAKLEVIFEKEN